MATIREAINSFTKEQKSELKDSLLSFQSKNPNYSQEDAQLALKNFVKGISNVKKNQNIGLGAEDNNEFNIEQSIAMRNLQTELPKMSQTPSVPIENMTDISQLPKVESSNAFVESLDPNNANDKAKLQDIVYTGAGSEKDIALKKLREVTPIGTSTTMDSGFISGTIHNALATAFGVEAADKIESGDIGAGIMAPIHAFGIASRALGTLFLQGDIRSDETFALKSVVDKVENGLVRSLAINESASKQIINLNSEIKSILKDNKISDEKKKVLTSAIEEEISSLKSQISAKGNKLVANTGIVLSNIIGRLASDPFAIEGLYKSLANSPRLLKSIGLKNARAVKLEDLSNAAAESGYRANQKFGELLESVKPADDLSVAERFNKTLEVKTQEGVIPRQKIGDVTGSTEQLSKVADEAKAVDIAAGTTRQIETIPGRPAIPERTEALLASKTKSGAKALMNKMKSGKLKALNNEKFDIIPSKTNPGKYHAVDNNGNLITEQRFFKGKVENNIESSRPSLAPRVETGDPIVFNSREAAQNRINSYKKSLINSYKKEQYEIVKDFGLDGEVYVVKSKGVPLPEKVTAPPIPEGTPSQIITDIPPSPKDIPKYDIVKLYEDKQFGIVKNGIQKTNPDGSKEILKAVTISDEPIIKTSIEQIEGVSERSLSTGEVLSRQAIRREKTAKLEAELAQAVQKSNKDLFELNKLSGNSKYRQKFIDKYGTAPERYLESVKHDPKDIASSLQRNGYLSNGKYKIDPDKSDLVDDLYTLITDNADKFSENVSSTTSTIREFVENQAMAARVKNQNISLLKDKSALIQPKLESYVLNELKSKMMSKSDLITNRSLTRDEVIEVLGKKGFGVEESMVNGKKIFSINSNDVLHNKFVDYLTRLADEKNPLTAVEVKDFIALNNKILRQSNAFAKEGKKVLTNEVVLGKINDDLDRMLEAKIMETPGLDIRKYNKNHAAAKIKLEELNRFRESILGNKMQTGSSLQSSTAKENIAKFLQKKIDKLSENPDLNEYMDLQEFFKSLGGIGSVEGGQTVNFADEINRIADGISLGYLRSIKKQDLSTIGKVGEVASPTGGFPAKISIVENAGFMMANPTLALQYMGGKFLSKLTLGKIKSTDIANSISKIRKTSLAKKAFSGPVSGNGKLTAAIIRSLGKTAEFANSMTDEEFDALKTSISNSKDLEVIRFLNEIEKARSAK